MPGPGGVLDQDAYTIEGLTHVISAIGEKRKLDERKRKK